MLDNILYCNEMLDDMSHLAFRMKMTMFQIQTVKGDIVNSEIISSMVLSAAVKISTILPTSRRPQITI